MSRNNITHLFNAYDLQADPYEADKINCQEVVDYCKASAWKSSLETAKRPTLDRTGLEKDQTAVLVFHI
jgi:hypothetical protein